MHGHLPKPLKFIIGLLVSLAAIIVGLAAVKVDLLGYIPMSLNSIVMPLQIAIGIAGVVSLLYLFMGCCESHDNNSHSHHQKR